MMMESLMVVDYYDDGGDGDAYHPDGTAMTTAPMTMTLPDAGLAMRIIIMIRVGDDNDKHDQGPLLLLLMCFVVQRHHVTLALCMSLDQTVSRILLLLS
jgi:hypothetical protein